ncbi:hypothetical protein [Photobacterium profundum]|uniref:Uncharacterized protein n=1 Tax=Photobacterium profundum 3TCK TaxID=314280 RepID=Q1Z4Y3_9GAMM|nr:hypothetical protein [Photobacterium profundum]EAS43488.1 hypothetical protein P3TCK_01489 [Photobacterium profundum 3TCK]
MDPVTPVEQITALFDIAPIVSFLVVSGGAIIGYQLAKKALQVARSKIKTA